MARILQYKDKYLASDFRKAIDIGKAQCGIKMDKNVAQMIDMTPEQICRRFGDTNKFTPIELRKLIQAINLSPYDVLKFMGYSDKQINTWRNNNGNL